MFYTLLFLLIRKSYSAFKHTHQLANQQGSFTRINSNDNSIIQYLIPGM